MILPEEFGTAKQSLFLRIRHAFIPISLLILRKKPTVL